MSGYCEGCSIRFFSTSSTSTRFPRVTDQSNPQGGGFVGSHGSTTSGLHGGMGGSPGSVIQNMMSPPCNVNTEIYLGL